MLRRHFSILLVAWSFCGMPVLCVGGALEHLCLPEQDHHSDIETDDCPHHEDETPEDGSCGHESDCASDPCSDNLIARERIDEADDLVTLVDVIWDDPSDYSTVSLPPACYPFSWLGLDVRIPYPPSDSPLLI